jgi:hypothetical protein
MHVTTVGLDLAKHVFQVHGIDQNGQVLIRRQLRRPTIILAPDRDTLLVEPHKLIERKSRGRELLSCTASVRQSGEDCNSRSASAQAT